MLARLISPRLAKTLGQQFVVENRPGAGSMLAAEAVGRAASDGHTLFMATIANVIAPALGAKFALSEDLAPIALIGSTPNVFIVHPSVSAMNVQELIALAKANPQGLTFASSGAGTAGHLSAELFNQRAGVHIVHVFYSGGSAQMAADLISGGQSDLCGRIDHVAADPGGKAEGIGGRARQTRGTPAQRADHGGSGDAGIPMRASGSGCLRRRERPRVSLTGSRTP